MNVQRGEIIRINLNPTSGREQQGKARPCLVISNSKFNHRRKMVIVLPITNTIKPKIKTLVPLPDNLSITGSVDTEQVRNLDLSDRWWKTTGVVLDQDLTDYMVGMLTTLLSC
ncbi:growth inhibitor [Xenococcus sp. PCC 7305]|uniref:type II toxin-antitoxin system PemK/MazF family toxin n=1 Tax=Xenococcus sp. PCC 7305 TaxID=102125 RepID=UPI0002AC3965|nr:type II toxin-antitoxin system PemK/MazF family toxin [Xenococcus sp. PCC 7305]ELS01774.1 growth inhibitor [Xenococcus sp. PCC 7305]